MIDAMTCSQLLQDVRFLGVQLGWNNDRNRLTNSFLCRVAEDPSGAAIPAGDDSVEILGDDCVVCAFHNGCQHRASHRLIIAYQTVSHGVT